MSNTFDERKIAPEGGTDIVVKRIIRSAQSQAFDVEIPAYFYRQARDQIFSVPHSPPSWRT